MDKVHLARIQLAQDEEDAFIQFLKECNEEDYFHPLIEIKQGLKDIFLGKAGREKVILNK